ncbi:MAG: hypothetical protein JAY90_18575 [Candidatus Thiodiazotropha lotti]|nr:hypothetical protein [Candidatus Thiodiazotropha lotti]
MGTTLPSDASRDNCNSSGDDPKQALLDDLYNGLGTLNDLKGALGALAQYDIGGGLGTETKGAGIPDKLEVSSINTHKIAQYTVVATDRGKFITATGTWSLLLTAAATLGDGFKLRIRNTGTGTITIDPNSTEQINGESTYKLEKGAGVDLLCTGSEWYLTGDAGHAINQGKHSIWIPANAMTAQETSGAEPATIELPTNDVMVNTMDFDPTTAEYAQYFIRMPESWNAGTVTFKPVWSHPATTTNYGVVWDLMARGLGDGDALDVAWGSSVSVIDTGGTTNDLYQGDESSGVTIGGTPASGDYVQYRVARLAASGSDTLAVDARLHGVLLYLTIDEKDDS